MTDFNLLTKKELAAALKFHPATISRFVKKGLPVLRVGPRRLRFEMEACRKWMRATFGK